jgi:hypothetical protein
MSIKNTVFMVATAICATLPLQAQAADLVTRNDTDLDSTSIINNGACSTILGAIGTTHAHSTNVVPGGKVKFACLANLHNCKADIYMTSNCNKSGATPVATVYFDVDTGLKADKTETHDAKFVIGGSGFQTTISPAS